MVVGLAGYGALKVLNTYNQSNDEDLIRQQMNFVMTDAKVYSTKLKTQGGGEGSFTGYKAPRKMLTTERVRLSMSFFGEWIIVQGWGTVTGKNKTTPVYMIGLYSAITDDWQLMIRIN